MYNHLPALCSNNIYEILLTIIKRNSQDEYFRMRFNGSRFYLEYLTGINANQNKRLKIRYAWYILSLGEKVYYHLSSALFIMNYLTCLHRKKTSIKYFLNTPTLHEYLNTNEIHYFDGEDSDELILNLLNEELHI